tara:strand:+ start:23226 stop:23717 length:492 start_codon:yes stop_codon:yes gene_type:complete
MASHIGLLDSVEGLIPLFQGTSSLIEDLRQSSSSFSTQTSLLSPLVLEIQSRSLPLPNPPEGFFHVIDQMLREGEGYFDLEDLLTEDDNNDLGKGLSVQKLLKVTKLEKGTKDDAACAICLEECDGKLCRRLLKCKHKFHVNCLDVWVAKQHTCPMCRSELLL